MKNSSIAVLALVTLFSIGYKDQVKKQSASSETNAIFPKGELGPA